MTRRVRKHLRFYYDDFMAEFPAVYRDNDLLATWLRLFVAAEKHWPAMPEVPRSVRPAHLRALVECGLVIPDGDYYRCLGLDKERTTRLDAARNAASTRWGNAEGTADA